MTDDTQYMRKALEEAQAAYEADEVPIGAVVVQAGRIIGRGHNMTETLKDCTAHAEMIAITAAFNFMNAKYLPDATLYVTVEPCHMCAGALYWSKIGRVVYGAHDEKQGAFTPHRRKDGLADERHSRWPLHPKTTLQYGLLAGECAALMKDFFAKKRKAAG